MQADKPYTVRAAVADDLPHIRQIFDSAKRFMDVSGNPHQWAVGYPPDEQLQADIQHGALYVLCDPPIDAPHAVFALLAGEDPTYRVIDGAWRNDAPYLTFHRVASDGYFRGVVHKAVAFARAAAPHIHSLRIDTHADNRPMRQAVAREGFVFCGVIYLQSGAPRNAYQWVDGDAAAEKDAR